MKRTISILLTALVAFGCAKEELAVLETSGNTEVSSGIGVSPINFAIKNGLENWGTKASVVDGFAVNDAVTVAAFQDNEECFNDAITKTTTGGWVMSEGSHYYWESYNAEYNGTDALDFCFVYPKQKIDNKSFTYTLGADPAKQKDLLVKYLPDTQAPEDYSAVPVAMDHALSLLAFEVKTRSGSYKVESITVNNTDGFYDTGVYTFDKPFDSRWGSLSKANSVKSISSPINVATVSSSEYTDVNDGDYCFLLPQDVASMDISVEYSVVMNETTYTATKSVPLSDNTFAAGKKYTYKIPLDPITAKLATPTNLKASEIGTDKIKFTWDAVDHADYYILTNEDTGATLESKWTATSYTWSSLSSGTTYTIGVVAVSNDDDFYKNSGKATAEEKTKSGSGTVGWDSGTISKKDWIDVTNDALEAVLRNAKNGVIIRVTAKNPAKNVTVTIKNSWNQHDFGTISFVKDSNDQTLDLSIPAEDVQYFFQYEDQEKGQFKGLVIHAGDNSMTIKRVQVIIL